MTFAVDSVCISISFDLTSDGRTMLAEQARNYPREQFPANLAPPPGAGVKVKPCGCCATLTPLVAVA